jgi:hypothetical protein
MSQPPYPPYGQPEPDPQGGGYQPPSYPPAQPTSGGSYQGGSYQGGGYQPGPPPGQGAYQPAAAPAVQGGYHPDQGGYQAAPPPPGGGYPGQPGQPYGAPPKKKGGALKIILIVIGVVVLLCVAGLAVAVYKGKNKVEDVVAASKISVAEPATLGGRKKVSDPSLQSSVQTLDSEMKKIQGTTSSVGAIYGDPAKQDLVMVAAASTLTGTAQSRFDELSSSLNTGGFSTSALKDTAPGPLGGIAKCGESKVAGVSTALCVWSDQGSVGMIMMFFKKTADLEKEFVSLRGQIEKKAS